MKKKIKYISVDGIEKSGNTSVFREMKRFFSDKPLNLQEKKGFSEEDIDYIESKIEKEKAFFVRTNSILKAVYEESKELRNLNYICNKYSENIRKERSLNHSSGGVHFFLLPENTYSIGDRFDQGVPHYAGDLIRFFREINNTSFAQGLDIRLISFDSEDKIYDIRDKIIKIIEEEYSF